jgi:hypothetical protein
MVQQFDSLNVSVKESVYLYSSGCCRLRNTLFVKLGTARGDGATWNRLENLFTEYLSVTICCVGCQEYQHIFATSGRFSILERAKNRS